jgi:hypothetical protein
VSDAIVWLAVIIDTIIVLAVTVYVIRFGLAPLTRGVSELTDEVRQIRILFEVDRELSDDDEQRSR